MFQGEVQAARSLQQPVATREGPGAHRTPSRAATKKARQTGPSVAGAPAPMALSGLIRHLVVRRKALEATLLQVDQQERDRRRRHTGDARGLAQGLRTVL